MHHMAGDSGRWVEGGADRHDRERGSRLQSCTLGLHKLRLGWSSIHFIHVDHANDMGDLFDSGVQESMRWSSVCKFVYTALISLCWSVTVICRLRRWMMICFPPAHAAWCDKQVTLQFTYGFLQPCTSCALKVHVWSLPARLNLKTSVKKIIKISVKWTKEQSFCPHFAADRGEALHVCFAEKFTLIPMIQIAFYST